MANTNDETRLIVRLRSESNDNSVQFSPLSKSWNPSELKDISSLAKWSLSSNKEAFGVDRLHDGNLDTYWQSDGPQPHYINMYFHKCWAIAQVSVYLDFKQDESYTPRQIALRVGNRVQDLYQISQLELNEPSGWIDILVSDPDKPPIKAFMLQLLVLSNHQGGKDTHVRQVKIMQHKHDGSIEHQS